MLRSCHRSLMQFGSNSSNSAWVIWYFTQLDDLPFPTVFHSRTWDAEQGEWDTTLGEQMRPKFGYANGKRPAGACYDGIPEGNPEFWSTGVPNLTFRVYTGKAFVMQGGRSRQDVYRFRSEKDLVISGGSSTVYHTINRIGKAPRFDLAYFNELYRVVFRPATGGEESFIFSEVRKRILGIPGSAGEKGAAGSAGVKLEYRRQWPLSSELSGGAAGSQYATGGGELSGAGMVQPQGVQVSGGACIPNPPISTVTEACIPGVVPTVLTLTPGVGWTGPPGPFTLTYDPAFMEWNFNESGVGLAFSFRCTAGPGNPWQLDVICNLGSVGTNQAFSVSSVLLDVTFAIILGLNVCIPSGVAILHVGP